VDGTVQFYTRVNALATPEAVVVDAGCGRGAYAQDPVQFRKNLRILRGKVNRVIGFDVDLAAEKNPFIDEFRRLEPGAAWPLENAEADLVVSDCVVEHLPDPDQFFSEARRVLKTGGHLCIRTPNVWNYFGVFSRLIPNKLHARVVSKTQDRRMEEDVFPTLYLCNSVSKMKRTMERHGFEAAVFGCETEPTNLSFSKAAYALGVIHQRFAPSFLGQAIFAFGRLSAPMQ